MAFVIWSLFLQPPPFVVFIIGKSLPLNHSPSEWFSVYKKIADAHGIAILLIQHLRKEKADDVFNRISGTTAISSAVDSSFTLVEERRGSGKARLSCVGRDIEYRELELYRSEENIWELASDSLTPLEGSDECFVSRLSALLESHSKWIGTPTELSEQIDPDGTLGISPKRVSRRLLQSAWTLEKERISFLVRRNNGKRLIALKNVIFRFQNGACPGPP